MRTMTPEALASLYNSRTDLAWLILVTIDHADLDAPLRLVNNTEDIVSNLNTYVHFPFEMSLPTEFDDRPPSVSFRIDAVDQRIVQALRQLNSAPTVTLDIINTDDLDEVVMGPVEFELREARYDLMVIEGQLAFEPVLEEAYPGTRMTPSLFPGIF